jgi:hypothetical protein
MIYTKRVIFMVLPLLFVPLVYGISSTPGACAAPNVAPTGAQCSTSPLGPPGNYITTCCWTEVGAEGIEIEYCQHCDYDPSTGTHSGCGEAHPVGAQQPTPTPPTFGRLPPVVLGDLPTLEQLPTTPPPLFGQNDANVPLAGGIEQPLTTTTPPPLFGRNIPQGGGFEVLQESETPPMFGQAVPEGPTLAGEDGDIQPMNTTFPTPQPFPPPTPGFKAPQTSIDISPDRAPEDGQYETDDGRNDIIPDTGITEQPETQQPEDSSEGAETAGPLT